MSYCNNKILLKVIATLCDQDGSNIAAYTKLTVTKETPYFYDNDGNKVNDLK